MAQRHTLDLAEQHRPAEDTGGIAAGVADAHPARGAGADAEVVDVGLRFPGLGPGVFAVEPASGAVDLQMQRLGADMALDVAHPRAEAYVHVGVVAEFGAQPLVVLDALLVAEPGQGGPGLLDAEAFDQLPAQLGQRKPVHQHHSLVEQQDATAVRCEADVLGQIGRRALAASGARCAHRWLRLAGAAAGCRRLISIDIGGDTQMPMNEIKRLGLRKHGNRCAAPINNFN